ncbi:c-type cytochrome [Enterovibrio calviensis]|uniref:c-type cytochrome n=1 Tax=Enterovibrio calviensis TaxID=91359 RepID=UPI0004802817|nr:cytochrome c [Enterovibrio calviensis]
MKRLIVSLTCFVPMLVNGQDYSAQIETRQQAFVEIGILAEKAEQLIDGDNTDWPALESVSAELNSHSQSLFTLFPSGSQATSKAQEAVWAKPEKFNQLLIEMDAGFQALYQSTKEQNANGAESGIEEAQSTCRGCHRTYRARW